MAVEEKKFDVKQVIRYLNHAFSKATRPFGSNNSKGTELYAIQVEFCYLIDNIEYGPKYIVPKLIAKANELIDSAAETASRK